MTGRLIAVVGPSGVGKDSVMRALAEAAPHIALVRRAITRAPGLGGEEYDALDNATFAARRDAGAYCLHWRAHGLQYGIPVQVQVKVQGGDTLMVNLSRSVLAQADAIFPALTVFNLTARPETLAARIASRQREDTTEIARRLARSVGAFPPGLDLHTLSNDGPLDQTVTAALAHLSRVPAS